MFRKRLVFSLLVAAGSFLLAAAVDAAGCQDGGGDFDCEEIPPIPDEQSVGREWAVLQIVTDGFGPASDDDVTAVACSSAQFGDYAVARWRKRAEVLPPNTFADPVPEFAYNELFVGRVGGGAVPVEADLFDVSRLPSNLPVGSGIYFRALTDETGAVVDLESLYSRYPDLADTFDRFVRANLYVVGRHQSTPLEDFGYLGVAGSKREPAYMVIGAREAPTAVTSLSGYRSPPVVAWMARVDTTCDADVLASVSAKPLD